MKIGIKHALPEVFLIFLSKVTLDEYTLLSQNEDGDTIVHEVCKNPNVGLDVLQKLLFKVRDSLQND